MKGKNYEVEELREASETKSKKYNVLSYLACILAAIIIWLVIMNVTDQKTPGSVEGGTEDRVTAVGLSV